MCLKAELDIFSPRKSHVDINLSIVIGIVYRSLSSIIFFCTVINFKKFTKKQNGEIKKSNFTFGRKIPFRYQFFQ